MSRQLPYSARCVECGQRAMPGKARCRKCWHRDEQTRPRSSPMERPLPRKSVEPPAQPEPEQDHILEELGRCEYCGHPFGLHENDCEGLVAFVDLTNEYGSEELREAE